MSGVFPKTPSSFDAWLRCLSPMSSVVPVCFNMLIQDISVKQILSPAGIRPQAYCSASPKLHPGTNSEFHLLTIATSKSVAHARAMCQKRNIPLSALRARRASKISCHLSSAPLCVMSLSCGIRPEARRRIDRFHESYFVEILKR